MDKFTGLRRVKEDAVHRVDLFKGAGERFKVAATAQYLPVVTNGPVPTGGLKGEMLYSLSLNS